MQYDPALRARVLRLAEDGHIELAPTGWYVLTEKGMAVLLACADSPVKVDQLTKPSLAFERMQTDLNRARNQS